MTRNGYLGNAVDDWTTLEAEVSGLCSYLAKQILNEE